MLLNSKKQFSIASRLFYRFLFGAVIVGAIMMAIAVGMIRHEVDELYDGELSQTAKVILSFYSNEKSELSPDKAQIVSPFIGSDNYENKLIIQLWDHNNQLIMRSTNAPNNPITNTLDSFNDVDIAGQEYRTYAFKGDANINANNFTIQVGQSSDIRDELEGNILKIFGYGLLVLLLVILAIMWWVTQQGLKPLRTIAEQISHRSSDNLEPVDLESVPLEIKGMTEALNKLFQRLRNSFDNERRFIADAAHELRTPLAGLKAQAQIAVQDKSRVDQSLKRIIEGVDRTSRLANQLLSLSRVDAVNSKKRELLKLSSVLNDVLHDLSGLIAKQQAKIINAVDNSICITAQKDECYVLLRNIIENAILYSSPNAKVEINSLVENNQTIIDISDNGPGVDEQKLERVFDPFYRDEEVTMPGSGLGLAIVKRISEKLNIDISIANKSMTNQGMVNIVSENENSGLVVRLVFVM